MILLNALLTPDIGLMFWTLVIFSILLLILRKFAWKPIVNALKSREEGIEKAINEAKTAREEVANLKSENEKILKEARLERDAIIKVAKERGDAIINEAKEDARTESKRIMLETKDMINKEKDIAFSELKSEISGMVIDLASKIIRKELSDSEQQKILIEKDLNEL